MDNYRATQVGGCTRAARDHYIYIYISLAPVDEFAGVMGKAMHASTHTHAHEPLRFGATPGVRLLVVETQFACCAAHRSCALLLDVDMVFPQPRITIVCMGETRPHSPNEAC